MQRPYALSCHCGAVRIEVDAELRDLSECNCSTCARHGFVHWKVPLNAVRLLSGKRALTAYMWREVSSHQFCPVCGTGLMRSGYPGDRVSINARCLDGVDVFDLEVSRFDGKTKMPPAT